MCMYSGYIDEKIEQMFMFSNVHELMLELVNLLIKAS